jgi:hypothetical protein
MRITLSLQHTPDFKAIIRTSVKALSDAINRTLEEGQQAQRATMARSFVERRREFLDRMVKIAPSDRARPDRLIGRLRIIGPEGAESRSSILSRHEDPPASTTAPGGYSIDPSVRIRGVFWLPTPVIRPQFSGVIPPKLFPTNLRLVDRHDVVGTLRAKVHTTSTGHLQLKGGQRTFVLFGANDGSPIGIFQRKGGKKGRSKGRRTLFRQGVGPQVRDDIQMLWAFRRTIHLKPRLHFYQVVPQTVQQRIAVNYSGFMSAALRGSR